MDSPRCLKCLGEGKIGQTYRVCGTNTYKCASCKTISHASLFDESDFTWRGNESKWYEKAREIFNKQNNKVGLERVKAIKENETHKV